LRQCNDIITTIRDWQDRLWPAICYVESGHDPNAVGDGGKAVGIAQIWEICVNDVNRIMGHGPNVGFKYDDRKNEKKSRAMFEIYTEYYGVRCAKEKARLHSLGLTDRMPDAAGEFSIGDLARIWNGGPDGWKKAATKEYELRVLAELKRLKELKNEQIEKP